MEHRKKCHRIYCNLYIQFNINDLDDNNKLLRWKMKNTKYYDNAIKTWTERDVYKRNIAIKNKLNFIELWKMNEVYYFI